MAMAPRWRSVRSIRPFLKPRPPRAVTRGSSTSLARTTSILRSTSSRLSCHKPRRARSRLIAKYTSSQVPEGLGGVGERRGIGGDGCVDLGEDLLEGGDGPAEGVGDLVPFSDELEDGPLESGEVREVGRAEPLASQDPEPLLHGVHPRTVDRGEVGDEARVGCEPPADERAMMDRDVVREQVNRGDRG